MEQLDNVVESILDSMVDDGDVRKSLSEGTLPADTYHMVVKRVNVRNLNPESFTPNRIDIGVNLEVDLGGGKKAFIWENISPQPYFTYRNGEEFKTISKDDPEYNASLNHDRKYKLWAGLYKAVNVGREQLSVKDVLEKLDGLSIRGRVAEQFTTPDGSKKFVNDAAMRETLMTAGCESKNYVTKFFV